RTQPLAGTLNLEPTMLKYRHRVLVLLFLLSMITYLDRVCIGVSSTRMREDLGISLENWGWVLSAFTISYALFEIPSGALGDRIGPRKILTRIIIWWSAFTSLTGAISNFYALVFARFMFGAGEAGAYPNCSSSISRWFPLAERARAHSFVWMASRLGGAITPWLVIPLQAAYGWRVTFLIFGSVGLVWAAVWYWWYRDHPIQKEGVTERELNEIGTGDSLEVRHGLPWNLALRQWNFWKIILMYHTYCWGSFFYLSWLPTY